MDLLHTMMTTKAKKAIKLQARMDSLSQKTREQLIDIILKKDNTEHKNCDKIVTLHQKVRDLEVIITSKEQTISELEKAIGRSRLYKFLVVILGGLLCVAILFIIY